MSLAWLETPAMSLRDEFRAWLVKESCYDEESARILLDQEWDGAYPEGLLGEDLLVDISNFLYWMAEFALERAYGADYYKGDGCWIRVVPDASYEDRSVVYILEMKSRRVLAVGCNGKTWNNEPEVIEYDLKDMIAQLSRAPRACPICGGPPKVEYICPDHGQLG